MNFLGYAFLISKCNCKNKLSLINFSGCVQYTLSASTDVIFYERWRRAGVHMIEASILLIPATI